MLTRLQLQIEQWELWIFRQRIEHRGILREMLDKVVTLSLQLDSVRAQREECLTQYTDLRTEHERLKGIEEDAINAGIKLGQSSNESLVGAVNWVQEHCSALEAQVAALTQVRGFQKLAIEQLLAHAQEESATQIKAKDREQFMMWSGWIAALSRVLYIVADPPAREDAKG